MSRELKVSELKPKTVVLLQKPERPMSTVWVVEVEREYVDFRAGKIGMEFFARRAGPDLDQIGDDDLPMKIYEYLGEI